MALSKDERLQVVDLLSISKARHGTYRAKSVVRKIECSERTVWRLWGQYDGTPESLNPHYGNQNPSKREIMDCEHSLIEQITAENPHIGWTQLHGQIVLQMGYEYSRPMNTIRQYCIRHGCAMRWK
jgi:hypothetical protein